MANQPDYYVILGIPEDATSDEVRSAYRQAARAHHPDVNPGDDGAADRFKQVQQAYEVLGDPSRRATYRRPRPRRGTDAGAPASSRRPPQGGNSYAAAWGMAPDRMAAAPHHVTNVGAPTSLNPELVEALLLLRAMLRRADLEHRFRRMVRDIEGW